MQVHVCLALKSNKEIETLCEELSGVCGKCNITELHEHVTSEPFSVRFARLDAGSASHKRIVPNGMSWPSALETANTR